MNRTAPAFRIPYLDNAKFLLIALVVLGHLLELAEGFPHREFLYAVIYSFHMPAK